MNSPELQLGGGEIIEFLLGVLTPSLETGLKNGKRKKVALYSGFLTPGRG